MTKLSRSGSVEGTVDAIEMTSKIALAQGAPARVDHLLSLDIPAVPGDGGTPIVKVSNEVVGISIAGNDKMSLAVPVSRLWRLAGRGAAEAPAPRGPVRRKTRV